MRTTADQNGPVQGSIDRLRGEMERMFEMACQRGGQALNAAGMRPGFMAEFPPTDLIETNDAIHLIASLPGVSPELLDVNVTGQFLRIRGSVAPSPHSQGGTVHRRERREGAFERAYPLPCAVDADSARASVADGLLTIRIAKATEEVGHKVPVSAGQGSQARPGGGPASE